MFYQCKICLPALPRIGVIALCLSATPMVQAHAAEPTLAERHAALREVLDDNPFGRPLYVESQAEGDLLAGSLYARLDQPFAALAGVLRDIDNWCDLLILHLNIKYCRADARLGEVQVNMGRKHYQELDDTYEMGFRFRLLHDGEDELSIRLYAPHGPFSSSDHLIELRLVPLAEPGVSFLRLGYQHRYGLPARLALRTYFATLGRHKLGFSRVDGQDPVRGVRGMIERNAMRLFLALDAYMAAEGAPPPQRATRRLELWHDGVEHHAEQLLELPREDYLAVKQRELDRQQGAL